MTLLGSGCPREWWYVHIGGEGIRREGGRGEGARDVVRDGGRDKCRRMEEGEW